MTKKEQQKKDNQQNVYRVKMQYRGFATEQFVKKLKESGAPVKVVLTIKKVKSSLPSLKTAVPKMLKVT